MKRIAIIFGIIIIFGNSSFAKGPTVWMGGAASLFLPSNTFNNSAVGFNDVSSPGFGLKGTFDWNFQPTLSLGAEVGLLRSSIDQQFWQVDNRGTVEGSYLIVPLLINTKILFQTGNVRPYFGIEFGASLLKNHLAFNSYDERIKQSFSYSTNNYRPSAAPEVGIQFKLSKTSNLNLAMRYCFITDLNPTYVIVYDEFGYVQDGQGYTENAHGRENYFEFSVGFQFATN